MTRLVVAALALFLLAAPAANAQFGSVEIADPLWRPFDGVPGGQLAVDGTGRVLWGSRTSDRIAAYERCGGWQPALLGEADSDIWPVGLKVNAAGDALAVWEHLDTDAYYSSFRPAGGSWGAQQEIVTGANHLDFGLTDAGEAIAVWNEVDALRAAVRPAGGSWSTTTLDDDNGPGFKLAVRGNGETMVVFQGALGLEAHHREAGSWSTEDVVDISPSSFEVEFDGSGRPVVVFSYSDDIYEVHRAAGWSDPDDLDPASAAGVADIVRHPGGIVAVWLDGPAAAVTRPLAFAALTAAGWGGVTSYPGFTEATAAVATDGRVLIAGTKADEIHGTVLSGLAAAPPAALERLSPEKTASTLYRDPVAAAGGTHFALGWGVHGGSNQRSEVISTGSCGAQQLPPSPPPPGGGGGGGTTVVDPPPVPKLSAFAKLPKTQRCVKGRKLKIKLPKPAGYTVKRITISVKGTRVATLTTRKQLKGPVTLRKLPKRGKYRVKVAIKLADGQTVTGSLTYRACR